MNLVKEDCRWRRFAIGARNMQDIMMARITNPRQLKRRITNYQSLI